MESGEWTDTEATAALMQDEKLKLEYRTELTALREELRATAPIERVSGFASLSADASSSILNQMAPASPPVFTFQTPQLELLLFSVNS